MTPHAPTRATALILFLAACSGAPNLTVEPTSLDFGEVVVGETGELAITLTNDGGGGTTVSFDVLGAGPFTPALAGGIEVGPGESRTAFVDATPIAVGTAVDVLQILSGQQVLQVALRVTGTAAPVDVDGDGYAVGPEDCDDSDPTVWNGAPELCDGIDNDCNQSVDDAADEDGDGDNRCVDCDDADADRGPSLAEACDGIDNDCDTIVDEGADADGDGATTCGLDPDCDDGDANTYPGAPELCNGLDEDCDAEVDEDWPDADADGERTCTDCDDADATAHHGAVEVCADAADNDCDGAIDDGCPPTDDDNDGVTTAQGDCDDNDPTRYPGATEICDGLLDEDCDSVIDNGCPPVDNDNDGFTPAQGDCDDNDPTRYPGATELCDGVVDEDCDTVVDNGCGPADDDNDGFTAGGGDCDDDDPNVHPGAPQLCDGVLDNDCDGPDDNEADADGDGVDLCDTPADCDDNEPSSFPGAPQLCDGVPDNDCDGPDDNEADADGDGVDLCDSPPDCDDAAPGNFPGNPELCDGQDNDCNGLAESLVDGDGDAVTTCDGDCDDANAAVHPGALELCNGLDDDCVLGVDDGFTDADGDGSASCLDCDDLDPSALPGAAELCDAVDNDCDLSTDEGWDDDSDGATTCGVDGLPGTSDDDCDDLDPARQPGGTELCDGVDNDCQGGTPADEADLDGDGVRVCGGDCADTGFGGWAQAIHPGAAEVCDGWDTDCSSGAPQADQADEVDGDGDGYLDCPTLAVGAVPPAGVTGGGDCVETAALLWSASIHPGAAEVCDGWDTDCTVAGGGGAADEVLEQDGDGDAYIDCAPVAGGAVLPAAVDGGGDCADAEAAVYPGAPQTCDGVLDNDCDSVDDANEVDDDADGETICDGDCDDANPDRFSTAAEVCSGLDLDCDNVAPPTCGSCLEALLDDPAMADGLLMIDPDGAGGQPSFETWCDQTTDGGGWTLLQRTVWDSAQTAPLNTNYAGWYGSNVGSATPGSAFRVAGQLWPAIYVSSNHLFRFDVRKAGDGSSCDPLYYRGDGGTLAVNASTATLGTVTSTVSLFLGNTLSAVGSGPSPACLSAGGVPWFYGICCYTCPTYQSYLWPTPRPMVHYTDTAPDMFGNMEANVCGGAPTTQSYAFTGLNAMEYYVR